MMAGTRNPNKDKDKDKNPKKPNRTRGKKGFQNPYAPPEKLGYKPRERAQTDINAAFNPAFRTIDRAVEDAGENHEERIKGTNQVHRGLMNELGRLEDPLAQHRAISNQFAQAQQGLAGELGAFGGANPEASGEFAAAQGAFGAMGGGAQAALAGAAQRQANWNNSVGMQAGVDFANRKTNAIEDYEDLVNDLSQQRFDLSQSVAEQLLSRVDALRDQKFNQQLSLAQYGLNEAQLAQQAQSARRLQKIIEGLMNKSGDGGGGGDDRYSGFANQTKRISAGKDEKGKDLVGSADTGTGGTAADMPDYNPPGGGGRKKYDRLTEDIEWARLNFPQAVYDEDQRRWEDDQGRPIRPINKPLRKRGKLVKKNPKLKGRASRVRNKRKSDEDKRSGR